MACFIAGFCKSYKRSLLSVFLSSLLYWGPISRIVALDSCPCNESDGETGTNKQNCSYQIQSKPESRAKSTADIICYNSYEINNFIIFTLGN